MPADARNGVRSRAETEQLERDSLPHAVIERLAASGKAAAPARRRRLVHGPKAATLAMLGAAALLTLGSVAVLLGSRQNPVASAPPLARMPRGPAEAAAPQLPTPAPAPAPSPEQAAPAAEAAVAAAQGQPARPAAEPAAVAPEPAPQAQAAPVPAAAPPQPAQPAPPATAESAVPHAPQAKPTAPAAAPAAPTPDPAPAPAAEPRAAEPGAEQAETGPAADSDKLMAAARKLLADDEPERAEALMRELLARAPQDHHAMELLVRALMDQDRGKEALPFARKMVQRRSKRVPYRLLLGDVLLMVGDEAGARVEWQAALQLDPGDREIKRRLGL
jgi:hypothetical protein